MRVRHLRYHHTLPQNFIPGIPGPTSLQQLPAEPKQQTSQGSLWAEFHPPPVAWRLPQPCQPPTNLAGPVPSILGSRPLSGLFFFWVRDIINRIGHHLPPLSLSRPEVATGEHGLSSVPAAPSRLQSLLEPTNLVLGLTASTRQHHRPISRGFSSLLYCYCHFQAKPALAPHFLHSLALHQTDRLWGSARWVAESRSYPIRDLCWVILLSSDPLFCCLFPHFQRCRGHVAEIGPMDPRKRPSTSQPFGHRGRPVKRGGKGLLGPGGTDPTNLQPAQSTSHPGPVSTQSPFSHPPYVSPGVLFGQSSRASQTPTTSNGTARASDGTQPLPVELLHLARAPAPEPGPNFSRQPDEQSSYPEFRIQSYRALTTQKSFEEHQRHIQAWVQLVSMSGLEGLTIAHRITEFKRGYSVAILRLPSSKALMDWIDGHGKSIPPQSARDKLPNLCFPPLTIFFSGACHTPCARHVPGRGSIRVELEPRPGGRLHDIISRLRALPRFSHRYEGRPRNRFGYIRRRPPSSLRPNPCPRNPDSSPL